MRRAKAAAAAVLLSWAVLPLAAQESEDWWTSLVRDLVNGASFLDYRGEDYVGGFFIAEREYRGNKPSSGEILRAWVSTELGFRKLNRGWIERLFPEIGRPVSAVDARWRLRPLYFSLYKENGVDYLRIDIQEAPRMGQGLIYRLITNQDGTRDLVDKKLDWIS